MLAQAPQNAAKREQARSPEMMTTLPLVYRTPAADAPPRPSPGRRRRPLRRHLASVQQQHRNGPGPPGDKDVTTTMISTHVPNQGGHNVRSPPSPFPTTANTVTTMGACGLQINGRPVATYLHKRCRYHPCESRLAAPSRRRLPHTVAAEILCAGSLPYGVIRVLQVTCHTARTSGG